MATREIGSADVRPKQLHAKLSPRERLRAIKNVKALIAKSADSSAAIAVNALPVISAQSEAMPMDNSISPATCPTDLFTDFTMPKFAAAIAASTGLFSLLAPLHKNVNAVNANAASTRWLKVPSPFVQLN